MRDKLTVINNYGDKAVDTTGFHGADIASQRIDDLDLHCLRFLLDRARTENVAVDIGCGHGAHGLRMGVLGANVYLFDMLNVQSMVTAANKLLQVNRLNSIEMDLRKITKTEIPKRIDIIYSQRFIHILAFR